MEAGQDRDDGGHRYDRQRDDRNELTPVHIALPHPTQLCGVSPRGCNGDARAVSAEFAPTRTVRFLAVFSGFARFEGQPATRVLVVQELKDWRPGVVECFGQFRSETLFVRDGAILGLERAGFTHRRLELGGWTFFAP